MCLISLVSCVGKVMKRMNLRRLQAYLDEMDEMPATMYGFRQHLSTQDVLFQLNKLVAKQATKNATRRLLALDRKGAFHNVSHASVVGNLRKTRCGRKNFGYLKDFLRRGRQRYVKQIEGVNHAFYADHIRVWTSRACSGARVEEVLQKAQTTAHEYGKT
ncbi:uncharacterized protein LOC144143201 [Haemaphysalis longicornis]